MLKKVGAMTWPRGLPRVIMSSHKFMFSEEVMKVGY